MSSILSKIVLGSSIGLTALTVGYVHMKQQSDREKMHEGVVRDIERQQRKKIENIYILEKQKELTKVLQKDLKQS